MLQEEEQEEEERGTPESQKSPPHVPGTLEVSTPSIDTSIIPEMLSQRLDYPLSFTVFVFAYMR